MKQLKKSFKVLTNIEWKQDISLEQLGFVNVPVTSEIPSTSINAQEVSRILESIKDQGDRIRSMKIEKKEKVSICLFKK